MKQSRLRKLFLLLSLLSLVMGIFVSMGSNLIEAIISQKRYSDRFGLAIIKSLQLYTSSENPKCNSTAKEPCQQIGTDLTIPLSTTIVKKPSTQTVNISDARKWRHFGNRKDIFVYSAYYRTERKDIVIIGVGRRKKNASIVCTFPISQGHPQVNASVEVIPEHHYRSNSAIYIKCSLGNATSPIPTTVELKVGTDSTRLPIIFPKPRRFNFTVCLACFHGPYRNYQKIIEMVETDLILGAQRFVMYKHSTSKQVDKILQYYVKRGVLELRPWHLPKMDVHYYGQMATIQDCILSSRNESKYLVLKDVDEVIAPHQHQNWDEMMGFLDDGGKHSTFLFCNTFFDTSWTQYNPDMLHTPSINILKYIWRDKKIFKHRVRSKAILKPKLVHVGGIHFPWGIETSCDVVPVKSSVALLHHYRRAKSKREKVKDSTMLKYSHELLSNMNKTYKELDALR